MPSFNCLADRKTFSVRLKPEIMKALRILSIEKEAALSDVMEEAMQDYLKKHIAEGKKQFKK